MKSELFNLSIENIKANVPNRKGCYAVFDSFGVCLYIGRSIRINERMCSHFINGGWRLCGSSETYLNKPNAPEGSNFCFWVCETLNELERRLIFELKPKENDIFNHQIGIPDESDGKNWVYADGRAALIIGESRDKENWWLVFAGNKTSTRHSFHKSNVTNGAQQ